MRICMVCQGFPPGQRGASYYVYYLAKTLTERGHKVTVMTRGSWRKTYVEEIDGITVYRVQFIPIYPYHLDLHGLLLNKLIKSMENNFDIIHLLPPLIPVIRTRLPLYVTVLGTIVEGVHQRVSLDLFTLGLKAFSGMYVSIERKIVNNAIGVSAVSASCADQLCVNYGIKDVEVVYNGVDTSLFVPAVTKEKNEPYILYTGALHSNKGIPDLIRSAVYVLKKYPDTRFIITGRGPSETSLRKLVHDLKLDHNVRFVGYVDRPQLIKLYQNASILVLPSYYEGLPTTILEAMACGIPVIGTNVYGTAEAISDGQTGLLIPPKAPRQLAEAINELLGDRALQRIMGQNGRQMAIKQYDWNVVTDNIERQYKSVVNR